MTYTNKSNLPIPLAVFLAADTYDGCDDPNTYSVTELLESTKSIVLSRHAAKIGKISHGDIMGEYSSRVGTALHDGVENAWVNHHRKALRSLGIPNKVIDNIRINPESDLNNGKNRDIFLEQRSSIKLGKFTVRGKFDIVYENRVYDIKSTKVWAWVMGTVFKKWRYQGSMYRVLNPEIITDDFITILLFFLDWKEHEQVQASRAKKKYPKHPALAATFGLLTADETKKWMINKLKDIDTHNKMKSQSQMTPCTQKELWQDDTVYAYYKNPTNIGRSTTNYDTMREAVDRQQLDGSVGRIDIRPGIARFCRYCPALNICHQARDLKQKGLLKL